MGVHPKVVQERLGHSSIQVTMDIYSVLTPTMQRDAITGFKSGSFYLPATSLISTHSLNYDN